MLKIIKNLSLQRWPWLLLTIIAVLLECVALYMQDVKGVEPCNECIYIRLGVFAIAAAGLIGAIAPRVPILRWSALAVWFSALGWSLYRANLLLGLEQKGTRGGRGRLCALQRLSRVDALGALGTGCVRATRHVWNGKLDVSQSIGDVLDLDCALGYQPDCGDYARWANSTRRLTWATNCRLRRLHQLTNK